MQVPSKSTELSSGASSVFAKLITGILCGLSAAASSTIAVPSSRIVVVRCSAKSWGCACVVQCPCHETRLGGLLATMTSQVHKTRPGSGLSLSVLGESVTVRRIRDLTTGFQNARRWLNGSSLVDHRGICIRVRIFFAIAGFAFTWLSLDGRNGIARFWSR
jgi:hypothetical protein